MCIRDRPRVDLARVQAEGHRGAEGEGRVLAHEVVGRGVAAVSYTHLRAHETVLDLVCRLLLEKKKQHDSHNYL